MQEVASAAVEASEYGALTGLVQAAGVIVSAGAAIGLTWRRRTQWGPVEQGVPKGAEKFGGLATAIALALLWTQYNSHAAMPLLRDVAIYGGIGAFIALLVYGVLNNVYTYEVDTSTATSNSSRKIIGGLWLEKAAQKARAKGKTIQDILKDAAYKIDAIWPRPARAFAQTLFVIFFLGLTSGGTVALSAAAMIYLISQTPAPAVPPTALTGLSFVVLEAAANRIAATGGPSSTTTTPAGYRVLIDDDFIGQAPAATALNGAMFPFGATEGVRKVTITNDHSATWTCAITLRSGTKLYGVTDALPDGNCVAGTLSQGAYEDFLSRRKTAGVPSPNAPSGSPVNAPVSWVLLVVLEAPSKQFSEGAYGYGAPVTRPTNFDVFFDNALVAQVEGSAANRGALAVLSEQIGVHEVTLRSQHGSVKCSVDVKPGNSHYALTTLDKSECVISPVSESVFNRFMERTGRTLAMPSDEKYKKQFPADPVV